MFETSSIYLEKLGQSELEANLIKGLGTTCKVIRKAVGNIPIVEKGEVDEFLQNSGKQLQKKCKKYEKERSKTICIVE